jgi:hypothetical protein
VRPILGGSGAFAGVQGDAETEHLADDTWRHTFRIVGMRTGPLFPVDPDATDGAPQDGPSAAVG